MIKENTIETESRTRGEIVNKKTIDNLVCSCHRGKCSNEVMNWLNAHSTGFQIPEFCGFFNIDEESAISLLNEMEKTGWVCTKIENFVKLSFEGDNKLNKDQIHDCLNTEKIGHNLLIYSVVDSTNNIAKYRGNEAGNGTVILSERQINGRGRMERHWIAEAGQDITMSIVLKKEQIEKEAYCQVGFAAAAAAYEMLAKIGFGNVQIKWPNDILISGKKVCGILCETSTVQNESSFLVLGIGMNINNTTFAKEIYKTATSLRLSSGITWNRNYIVAQICNEVERMLALIANKGFSQIVEIYRKKCAYLGQKVRVSRGSKTIFGRFCDIDEQGRLVLLSDDGEKIHFNSGEVSLRLDY